MLWRKTRKKWRLQHIAVYSAFMIAEKILAGEASCQSSSSAFWTVAQKDIPVKIEVLTEVVKRNEISIVCGWINFFIPALLFVDLSFGSRASSIRCVCCGRASFI